MATATSLEMAKTYRVQHLQDFILLTGVQAVNDNHQPCLVLSEAINGFCHPGHQFHLTLQDLHKAQKRQVRHIPLEAQEIPIQREERNPKFLLLAVVPFTPWHKGFSYGHNT